MVGVTGEGIEASLVYDFKNRVVTRTINGLRTYYIYDGWSLIAEYTESGMTAKYIHGRKLDEIILTVNEHGSFFHHHDALGSVTEITDSRGELVESYIYDDFGVPRIIGADGKELARSSVGNRFMFIGRSYWTEFGIYDFRNRVYSAVIGRFVQTDPLRFEAGDINIYRYCLNNPLNFVDPFGLQADPNNPSLGEFGLPGQSGYTTGYENVVKVELPDGGEAIFTILYPDVRSVSVFKWNGVNSFYRSSYGWEYPGSGYQSWYDENANTEGIAAYYWVWHDGEI